MKRGAPLVSYAQYTGARHGIDNDHCLHARQRPRLSLSVPLKYRIFDNDRCSKRTGEPDWSDVIPLEVIETILYHCNDCPKTRESMRWACRRWKMELKMPPPAPRFWKHIYLDFFDSVGTVYVCFACMDRRWGPAIQEYVYAAKQISAEEGTSDSAFFCSIVCRERWVNANPKLLFAG